jgi:pyrroloquinoline quinone biosynthesis protein E
MPLGAKFEVTHRCNLRCGFCYTDSPRRTIERPTDLDAQAWAAIADDALGLGIVEAVVTGGEPLMRADLALGLVD